jgi:AcrR family transcriptional regulator
MAPPVRRRNLRGHGALLRDEILTAAVRLIDSADGEAEVSLRGIAREAGIAAPSVYAHFADRQEVLAAVAEAGWEQVGAEITARGAAGATPRDRLVLGCQAYVSFAERFPLRYALMTQSATVPPVARQVLATVTRGLLACRSRATPTAPGRTAHRIAASLAVAVHGVAMLHRSDTPNLWLSDFSTDEIIRSLVDAAILRLDHPRGTGPKPESR